MTENEVKLILEEVYEYRKLGTVEKLKSLKEQFCPHQIDSTSCKHRNCNKCDKYRKENEEYHKLGTVEEVTKAVEKTKPIKADITEIESGTKYLKCPKCKLTTVIYNEMIVGYCPKCGQKLEK